MDQDTSKQMVFTGIDGKKVTAAFEDVTVTSDFGAVLLREVDRKVGLIEKLAGCIRDERVAHKVRHELPEMLRQRIYQICCGYEDANDCDSLRADPAFKVAVGRDPLNEDNLASQPSMSRLENAVNKRDLLRMAYALVDQYMNSFAAEPTAVVLDMDPTAVITYGDQQLRLFNAFEDEYCLMPFHLYDGLTGKLIAAVLRPGKTPTAAEIISILKRVIRRLRSRWKNTMLIFRADSHHTKPEVMNWLEDHGVQFVTGLGPNSRLDKLFETTINDARRRFAQTHQETRLYASGYYAASSWGEKTRRVVCRVVVNINGCVDTRYVVTSFQQTGAKYLYEVVYCGRGNAELMIKDHKVGLRSDRCSCHDAAANQFRLILSSAAYVLLHEVRHKYLRGTELARCQFTTLRLKLLKIGARVEVLKTAVRFFLPSAFPMKEVFARVLALLQVPCRT
jgi:hypothetical protein